MKKYAVAIANLDGDIHIKIVEAIDPLNAMKAAYIAYGKSEYPHDASVIEETISWLNQYSSEESLKEGIFNVDQSIEYKEIE